MSTLFLFTHASDFLGEVRLQAGALAHVTLTHRGEDLLGPGMKDWQTRGVPVRREMFGTKDRPHDIVFYQERVQPRDPKFGEALRQWCSERHVAVLAVPNHVHEDCWNLLLRLPLEPSERFMLLSTLVQASADELVSWRTFLQNATRIVTEEEGGADAAIADLQQKAAEGLVKRFAKT